MAPPPALSMTLWTVFISSMVLFYFFHAFWHFPTERQCRVHFVPKNVCWNSSSYEWLRRYATSGKNKSADLAYSWREKCLEGNCLSEERLKMLLRQPSWTSKETLTLVTPSCAYWELLVLERGALLDSGFKSSSFAGPSLPRDTLIPYDNSSCLLLH